MITDRERLALLYLQQSADDPESDRWVSLVKTPTMVDFLRLNPPADFPDPSGDWQRILSGGELPCSRYDLWSLAQPLRGYIEGIITLDQELNAVALTQKGRDLIANNFMEKEVTPTVVQRITIKDSQLGNLAVSALGAASIATSVSALLVTQSALSSQTVVDTPWPVTTSHKRSDIMGAGIGYAILGLEDATVARLFATLGDQALPSRAEGQCEEVYFDDLTEMAEVFGALNNAIARARVVEAQGGDRQEAFERAWEDECIVRASHFAAYRHNRSLTTPATVTPGLKYIVWGLPREQAPRIRLLRPQEIIGESLSVSRDAHEVYFADATTLPSALSAFQAGVKEAAGDSRELIRLLAATAMRRHLGRE